MAHGRNYHAPKRWPIRCQTVPILERKKTYTDRPGPARLDLITIADDFYAPLRVDGDARPAVKVTTRLHIDRIAKGDPLDVEQSIRHVHDHSVARRRLREPSENRLPNTSATFSRMTSIQLFPQDRYQTRGRPEQSKRLSERDDDRVDRGKLMCLYKGTPPSGINAAYLAPFRPPCLPRAVPDLARAQQYYSSDNRSLRKMASISSKSNVTNSRGLIARSST